MQKSSGSYSFGSVYLPTSKLGVTKAHFSFFHNKTHPTVCTVQHCITDCIQWSTVTVSTVLLAVYISALHYWLNTVQYCTQSVLHCWLCTVHPCITECKQCSTVNSQYCFVGCVQCSSVVYSTEKVMVGPPQCQLIGTSLSPVLQNVLHYVLYLGTGLYTVHCTALSTVL